MGACICLRIVVHISFVVKDVSRKDLQPMVHYLSVSDLTGNDQSTNVRQARASLFTHQKSISLKIVLHRIFRINGVLAKFLELMLANTHVLIFFVNFFSRNSQSW